MDKPRWRFPEAKPEALPTGVRVQDLVLRFPGDQTPSGGEVRVVYLREDEEIGERLIALDPGEPDTLLPALGPWLEQMLARRTALPGGSRSDVTPKPPRPTPEPGRPLGTL